MQKALQEVLFTLIFVPLSKESWFSKTYGVIGNTSDFGSDILGSSPSRSTQKISQVLGYQLLPQDCIQEGAETGAVFNDFQKSRRLDTTSGLLFFCPNQ